MILLLVIFCLLSPASSNPQIDCYLRDQACDITEDNLIHTYLDISSIGECKLLCEDEDSCVGFTYIAFTYNGCFLFNSCIERRPCENCITASTQNECLCSIRFNGDVNSDNLLDFIGGVTDEHECKQFCMSNEDCLIYTYFTKERPTLPSSCFLLSKEDFQMPIIPCDNCMSGPGTCSVGQKCKAAFISNGTNIQVFHAEEDMTVHLVAGEMDCFADIDVVAIGGGGSHVSGIYGGAGSGFIAEGSIRMWVNASEAVIHVGSTDEPSTVNLGEEVVFEAAMGGKGDV